jgi:hypothetical protein
MQRRNYRWKIDTRGADLSFEVADKLAGVYYDFIAPGTTTKAHGTVPEYETIARLLAENMPAYAEPEIRKCLEDGSIICENPIEYGPALPKPKKVMRSKLPSPEGMEYWVTEGLFEERRRKEKYALMNDTELYKLTGKDVRKLTHPQLRGAFRRLYP